MLYISATRVAAFQVWLARNRSLPLVRNQSNQPHGPFDAAEQKSFDLVGVRLRGAIPAAYSAASLIPRLPSSRFAPDILTALGWRIMFSSTWRSIFRNSTCAMCALRNRTFDSSGKRCRSSRNASRGRSRHSQSRLAMTSYANGNPSRNVSSPK
eukprot:590713-Prymnesium_polylepis.1